MKIAQLGMHVSASILLGFGRKLLMVFKTRWHKPRQPVKDGVRSLLPLLAQLLPADSLAYDVRPNVTDWIGRKGTGMPVPERKPPKLIIAAKSVRRQDLSSEERWPYAIATPADSIEDIAPAAEIAQEGKAVC
jgi:hypothetical protein